MALLRQVLKLGQVSRSVPVAFYHEKVIDHYENPRNVGKMDPKKINVGTGLVGAPACGDVMKLQIEVRIGNISHCGVRLWLTLGLMRVPRYYCACSMVFPQSLLLLRSDITVFISHS